MKTSELRPQRGAVGSILAMYLFVLSLSAWAQAPSSRQIPFPGVTTNIAPGTTGQTLTMRVLDNSNPPVALYCETQTLDVDANGAITFNLGTGTAVNPPCPSAPPGLNPADFASGSTRSLDVVDTNGNSVLANPIPLTAVAFALSPGPQGPAGPKGDKGDQGPPGQQGPPGAINNIVAGTGLVGGGTTPTVTVAIADGGVGTAQLAPGAVTGAKVAAPLAISASVANNGVVQVANTNSNGFAILGNGVLWGVEGDSSGGIGVAGTTTTGTGVQGQASGTSGNTIGVRGVSFSPTGVGVSGEANHIGVFGRGNPAGLFQGDVQVLGNLNSTGNFVGNGGGLTNLNAASLTNGIRVQPNGSNPPNIINGHSANSVAAGKSGATIAGGGSNSPANNTVNNDFGTVGGGSGNTASYFATAGGGSFNRATGGAATIAGGSGNTASGDDATVSGGDSNTASGRGAVVPGGFGNTATGDYSFAAGLNVGAGYNGCFVWGDDSIGSFDPLLYCLAANQFMARAAGGFFFYTSKTLNTGVTVPPGGGSWSSLSDRNVKEHFATVDPHQVLARVAQLPIQSWNYKSQDAAIRHIGPMAQDFYAVFHVGEDDRHITEIDEGGVALAAIQGLNQKLEEQIRRQDEQIKQQADQIRELRETIQQLSQRVSSPN